MGGLFVEGFGLYYTGKVEDDVSIDNPLNTNESYSTVALGVGLGHKWTTFNDQFSMEVNLGVGRNINPHDFQENFIGRAAFSLGFRF